MFAWKSASTLVSSSRFTDELSELVRYQTAIAIKGPYEMASFPLFCHYPPAYSQRARSPCQQSEGSNLQKTVRAVQ